MSTKLSEQQSNLIGLGAAAYFIATGVGRTPRNTIAREKIERATPPEAPRFITYVQKHIPFWKAVVTMESLDYAAAIRGWSTFIQLILNALDRGKDTEFVLTDDVFVFMIAIGATKMGIATEAQQMLAQEIFVEAQDSLPREQAEEEEPVEAVEA